MKHALLALLCTGAVLSLAACGGGGGGGGSGDSGTGGSSTGTGTGGSDTGGTGTGGSDTGGTGTGTSLNTDEHAATNAAFKHRQWAGTATVQMPSTNLSTAAQTNTALLPVNYQTFMNGAPIADDTVSLRTNTDGSVTLLDGTTTVAIFDRGSMNFYKSANGIDFAVMSKTSTKPVIGFGSNAIVPGLVTQTNSLWIGKMTYATFGYWAQVNHGTPTGKTSAVNAFGSGLAFAAGSGAIEGYLPSGPLSFTGVAVGALVSSDASAGEYSYTPMIGTAVLTIATTGGGITFGGSGGASSSGLVLNFPDYRLEANLGSMSGGTYSGTFTKVVPLGSSTLLPTNVASYNAGNSWRANMYGPSATNPTEAAGVFSLIQTSGTKLVGIEGAFGGKKN